MQLSVTKINITLLGATIALTPLIWLIGARDSTVGADTQSYINNYLRRIDCQCMGDSEFGYEMLMFILARFDASPQALLTSYAVISVGLMLYVAYLAARFIAEKAVISRGEMHYVFLFVLGALLVSPLTMSVLLNGLRQGISSLALAAVIIQLSRSRLKSAGALSALALSFHLSTVFYLVAIALFYIFRRRLTTVRSLLALCAFAALYVTGISQILVMAFFPQLAQMVYEYGQNAPRVERLRTGVRLDFTVFTFALFLLAVMISRLLPRKVERQTFLFFSLVAATAIPFFLLGWGFFSNRYLFTTWILFVVMASVYITLLLKSNGLIKISPILMYFPAMLWFSWRIALQ